MLSGADPLPSASEPAAAPPSEPEAKVTRVQGVPLDQLGIASGCKVEVLWELEGENDSAQTVWWGASIVAEADGVALGEPGEARLLYVAQHGFEEETRRVVFLPGSYLWDAALKERLPFRKEGEEGPRLAELGEEDEGDELYDHDEAEADRLEAESGGALRVGMPVKARFQGGERYCAGTIVEVHEDGTYDVLYEDNVCEQNVPRDVIEVVTLAPAVRAALQSTEQETCAESTADFFELFVKTLTSGPMFAKLPAEKQQIASDKVRAMKPHFEAELAALRDERGWGATVTGEDIKELLPRVAQRQARASA